MKQDLSAVASSGSTQLTSEQCAIYTAACRLFTASAGPSGQGNQRRKAEGYQSNRKEPLVENVLVNGLVAVAENFRNLLVNVTGRFGDVLGGLQTASQNSTQVLTHSRQDFGMRKGSMHAIDVHTPSIFSFSAGGDLLSRTLPGAVPSAQVGLASGFGKGPGVTPPLTTTDKPIQNKTHTQPNTAGVSCRSRHCITDASTHSQATIRNRLSNNHTNVVLC